MATDVRTIHTLWVCMRNVYGLGWVGGLRA